MSREAETGLYYGWVILGVATFSLAVSNGLAIGGIPVFSEWIRNDLIASGAIRKEQAQTVVSNFGTITFLVAGLSAPFAGYFIQKYDLRKLMILGSAILGSGLLIHSQAQNAETIYAARVLFGISLGFIGVLLVSVLVSNWFEKKRGLALGILFTGTSIGGMLIPLIASPLILRYGWRAAMMAMSLIIWLLLIPAVLFLVRSKPGSRQGGQMKEEGISAAGNAAGMTLSEALKTPLFWGLAICAAMVFYPLFVTTQQLILYIRSPKIGVAPETAAFIQSLLAFLSIGGKFLFGFLSDRLNPIRVFAICCGVMFLATFVLFGLSSATILLFVVPFGFSYGGAFVLLQRLVADLFGMKDYAKILAALTLIETIGASIGGRITGAIADADGGDYSRAFYFLILAAGGAFCLSIILNFMGRRYETAEEGQ